MSILQGPEMGWRRGTTVGARQQRQLTLKERYFFVIDKYVKDVKQDQRIAPDLMESIIRPTDPVNQELWRPAMQINKFRSKITKIRVSTFWTSRKSTASRWRPTQPARLVSFKTIKASQASTNQKNTVFGAARRFLL